MKISRPTARLPRTMTALETWGFGLTTHLSWFFTLPLMAIALGANVVLLMLPAVMVGMAVNFQVKRIGLQCLEIAGGTPSYMTILLRRYPSLGSYGAIGYWLAWAASVPISSVVLTDLIKAHLEPLGMNGSETFLRVGFTLLPYVMALSGSRALAIVHLFFIFPGIIFSLLFCLQGVAWLTFSSDSPGLWPAAWEQLPPDALNLQNSAKWLFFALWLTASCDTSSAFVADSQQPRKTLGFLTVAAWFIPIIFLGAALVLARLAMDVEGKGDIFQIVLSAARPFWGDSASLLVTLLLTCCCLLNSATGVSNAPRMLHQLALDGYISPVFAVVSRRGVLSPSLLAGLILGLVCLGWGDVSGIVVITGTGLLASFFCFWLGLWLQRRNPEVKWAWWWLIWCGIDGVVIVVGGSAWGVQNLIIGLLLPLIILAIDAAIRRIPFAPLHAAWWEKFTPLQTPYFIKDFVAFQIIVLLTLVCGSVAVTWAVKDTLDSHAIANHNDLFSVWLIVIAFFAIAVACWTILPQVAAIDEAREQAEGLFITALDTVPDTILVLDNYGIIQQINPAAETLFKISSKRLIGQHLSTFLPDLEQTPATWLSKNEHILKRSHWLPAEAETSASPDCCNVETTISHRSNYRLSEYIVILRDITDRKQAEAILKEQTLQLRQTLENLQQTQTQLIQTEKMSGLGQLVAGVAHEINNPVNFITGNLPHAHQYVQDLLNIISLYRHHYPNPVTEIQAESAAIELDFLYEDLPKLLSSIEIGADRISQIVLSLRNFSRLDESDMKPVNIHDGINSTLLILQHRLKAKSDFPDIEVIKRYGKLPLIECYAGQLNQVFMNLLTNAIDAIEQHRDFIPQGIITITTQMQGANQVSIKIADNGMGIAEGASTRLFDPFFTTKPIGQGTGLGLSISYQIVTRHHGHLSYHSTPGEGAEFVCEIPICLD